MAPGFAAQPTGAAAASDAAQYPCQRLVEDDVVVDAKAVGRLGERMAAALLVVKGYEVVWRNYRYAGREIVLLVRRGSTLAAVEVKLRRGDRFGSAVEAVDGRKIARIHQALAGALAMFDEPLEPRVDVVVIDVDAQLTEMTIRHIEAVG